MTYLPVLIAAVYLAVTVFVLSLLSRFVSAHERVAKALEEVARRNERGN